MPKRDYTLADPNFTLQNEAGQYAMFFYHESNAATEATHRSRMEGATWTPVPFPGWAEYIENRAPNA